MQPHKLVFVQHEQGSGKLSHDNAIRAWTHVARGKWKPKQFEIKIWDPRKVGVKHDEDTTADEVQNEGSTIVLPYSALQQAYASKNCLPLIESPDCYGHTELVISTTIRYVERSYSPRQFTPDQETQYNLAVCNVPHSEFAIKSGVDSLLNGQVRRAFASFEYAAQNLRSCMAYPLCDRMADILSTVFSALLYAESRNQHEIVQLFLKQIGGLAAVSGGRSHPLVIIMQDLLARGITPRLIATIASIETTTAAEAAAVDAMDPLRGKLDIVQQTLLKERMWFEHKCQLLGSDYTIQEAEYTYRKLREQENYRYNIQFLTLSMARFYLTHHQYVGAAEVLSDAPDDLNEWIENGWRATTPRTAPLSMMALIWRLSVLGEDLAGQDRHEAADAMFRLSILAGQRYMQPDHPTRIQAQQTYSGYLITQNRKAEADHVEAMIDLGLGMYMLNIGG